MIEVQNDLTLRKKREFRYKYNTQIMLICQFMSMGISFLLIPITMNYIGVSDYGIWITLVGIIEWFNLFDIGLGHGLRNKYAEARVTGDMTAVRGYVSTAFFSLIIISSLIFLIFNISYFFVDWSLMLNAPKYMEHDLQILILFIGSFFCIRFVINIVNILITAEQHPSVVKIIALIGNIIALLTIYILTKTAEPSILFLGIFLSVSQLFPLLVAFIYLFSTKYRPILPRLSQFSSKYIRLIFSLGIQFFFIQITALVLFTTNNLIIVHTSGPEDVTEFNIAYKYINIIFLIFMTLLTPLWSACTEAYARQDIDWIKSVFKRMNNIWLALVGVGLILVFISPFTYNIWLKDEIKPDFVLLGLLLIYMALWMRYTLYRTFMNSIGKIRLQFYITTAESILHIPFAVYMGTMFGIYGVVFVMILSAVINSIWEPIQYRRILYNTAKGIWNK